MSSFSVIRHKISKSLELPEDVLGAAFRIQIIGNTVILCGCKKILNYTSEAITVLTKEGTVTLCGRYLKCLYFFENTIEISGEISSVRIDNK